jgi:ketosteroid isomerase-like protein
MKSSQPLWKYWVQNNKWVVYNITPVAIDIHDDIAIVFLSFQEIWKHKDGPDKEGRGKWMQIFRKTDGKWLIISETGFDFSSSTN